MTKIYKVIKALNDGRMVSCMVDHRSSLCLEYRPDLVTKPVVGYILAFTDKGHASGFLMWHRPPAGNPPLQLWLARTTKAKKPTSLVLVELNIHNFKRVVESFWRTGSVYGRERIELPFGTVYCSDCELIKQIE